MIPKFLGKWTNPLVFGAAGYMLKKPALLGVAGYTAGQALNQSFMGTKSETVSGGFWE